MNHFYTCLTAFLLILGFTGDIQALEVGTGAVEITPSLKDASKRGGKVWIAGYSMNRPADGVNDPLWARSMVFTQGKTTVVLCALDVVGILHYELWDIRKRVERELGIPASHVVIAGTHTHSGPDTLGIWGPHPFQSGKDPAYMKELAEKTFQSIRRAVKSRRPARLVYASTEVKSLLRDSRRPKIIDPQVAIVQAIDKKGKTIGTMVSYALHPEVLTSRNKKITSDLCHYFREYVEKSLGGRAIFFAGALGGLQAPKTRGKRNFDEAKRMGHVLGKATVTALKKAGSVGKPRIWAQTKRLDLPMVNYRFVLATYAGLFGTKNRSRILRYNRGRLIMHIPADVTVINLGEIQVASIPGELVPELGFVLKKTMAGKKPFLIGLGNNEIGYILPAKQWTNRGYEETMSLGPETASKVMTGLLELIHRANERLVP